MPAPCPMANCCGTPPPCNRQVCVNASANCKTSQLLAGATVTVTQGSTTYTGTTDATGKFCTPVGIAAGTWTATVVQSAIPCLNTVTAQTTTFTTADCTTHTLTFHFTLSSSCCCTWCQDFSGTVISCVEVLDPSVVLSFSDSIWGSCTLSLNGACNWTGTLLVNVPACTVCPAVANLPVTVSVGFGSDGFWRMSASFPLGSVGGQNCPVIGAGPQPIVTGIEASTCSCNPLDLTFTWSASNQVDCGAPTHNITVTGP